MGGVMRFVFALIWIALALGVTGELVDATIFAKQNAAKAFVTKGVSASWWNNYILDAKPTIKSK